MNGVENHYVWHDVLPTCAHDYVLPEIRRIVRTLYPNGPVTIVDIGCGNGYATSLLAGLGHSVIGVDASPSGIEIARAAYPGVRFEVCSVYDEALDETAGGPAECVVSLEVVEHLFHPKRLFEQSYRLLRPGGRLIVSTPYHGYLKNLALSFVNGWDRHFSVEWDGGHIKFFSKTTLARMARGAGFGRTRFYGVGRLPALWKSIIMVAQKI
jgi:2-polyprenyl-6-hydroxyphenyl methylase/3-demethylubiquinone-9 3-methyltransferase